MRWGFTFQEGMGGSYHLLVRPDDERPFAFRATAAVDDLLRFLNDGLATLTGVVDMPGFADQASMTGTLEISPVFGRILNYQLSFTANDGRRYRFAGHKDLKLLHLGESLARLPAVVYDELGRDVAAVAATFDVARDLGPLLRTLRPVLERA